MKTRSTRSLRRLLFKIQYYSQYTDLICQMERALARKPQKFQIDLIGAGEIPPDAALLMRSILLKRATETHLITNARSSLEGASVLVWLLGDTRRIREDAKLHFRRTANQGDDEEQESWKKEAMECDPLSESDLEEADYSQVLQYINEFLPVKELAGRPISLEVLRQFGLVDNEKVDLFLASAFAKRESNSEVALPPKKVEEKMTPSKPIVSQADEPNRAE